MIELLEPVYVPIMLEPLARAGNEPEFAAHVSYCQQELVVAQKANSQ